jgi:hypothetical protein
MFQGFQEAFSLSGENILIVVFVFIVVPLFVIHD